MTMTTTGRRTDWKQIFDDDEKAKSKKSFNSQILFKAIDSEVIWIIQLC